MQCVIRTKDARIVQLNGDAHRKDARIVELERQLAEKNETMSAFIAAGNENATLQARIESLERDLANAEAGNETFMDQRDAERKTVADLRIEMNKQKEEMKAKDQSFERTNVETLKRQIETFKFLRVKQTDENEKLKSEVKKMKEEDRDFLADKMRLDAMHQEEVKTLRRRISSLEAVKDHDQDKALLQEALRQHEVLKRQVQELESLKTSSSSTFNALAGVASVMNRANRRCTAKDVDELKERTGELVRLAVAGDGLMAGELKQRQDAISSCFFTSFSHAVMSLEDERVEELKRRRGYD